MTALTSNLTATVTVADPDVVGPLAVFPLIAAQPRTLRYQAFAQGGVTVHELEEASVNDLLVSNALDVPVLLYEGEEVLGAQQNRTFDVSVLVPAGTELQVPVSCVEAQRWEGGRHGEAFTPAPQTAYPELRRAKSERMRGRLAAGEEARADQGAVWSMVAAKAQRHGVASPTGALHDVSTVAATSSRRCPAGSSRGPTRSACSRRSRGASSWSTTSAIPTRSPRSTPRSCRATRWTRSRRRRRTRRPPTPPVSSCTR